MADESEVTEQRIYGSNRFLDFLKLLFDARDLEVETAYPVAVPVIPLIDAGGIEYRTNRRETGFIKGGLQVGVGLPCAYWNQRQVSSPSFPDTIATLSKVLISTNVAQRINFGVCGIVPFGAPGGEVTDFRQRIINPVVNSPESRFGLTLTDGTLGFTQTSAFHLAANTPFEIPLEWLDTNNVDAGRHGLAIEGTVAASELAITIWWVERPFVPSDAQWS